MANRRTPIAIRSSVARKGRKDKEVLNRIGNVIRTVRLIRGLTQAELGRQTDTSQNHISNIEKGKREPGIFLLAKISRALEVPIDLLILPALEPSRLSDPESVSLGTELRDL